MDSLMIFARKARSFVKDRESRRQSSFSLLGALSAARAAVAANSEAAFFAAFSEKRAVRFNLAKQRGLGQMKIKRNFFALKAHSRTKGHSALQAFVWQMISLAVLNETGARFKKAKSHIGRNTFLTEFFDPIIMKRPRAVIIFSAG